MRRHVTQRRGLELLAFAGGLVVALVVGAVAFGDSGQATTNTVLAVAYPAARTSSRVASNAPAQKTRTQGEPALGKYQGALDQAVTDAAKLGVKLDIAIWQPGWQQPMSAGSADQPRRMWSMAKPLTAIAALEAAARAGQDPSPALQDAIHSAITRSENCRQRRVILGLQQMTGGPEKAWVVWRNTGRRAQLDLAPKPATEVADPSCENYLRQSGTGISNPLGPSLLLGTVEWTAAGAARFAGLLEEGRTYRQIGDEVLSVMREPKLKSRELASLDDYSVDPAWGAGRTLAAWRPAYKAGWGGASSGAFLAGQVIALEAGGRPVGIAVFARPNAQPATDDPGDTKAPSAIESALKHLRQALPAPG